VLQLFFNHHHLIKVPEWQRKKERSIGFHEKKNKTKNPPEAKRPCTTSYPSPQLLMRSREAKTKENPKDSPLNFKTQKRKTRSIG